MPTRATTKTASKTRPTASSPAKKTAGPAPSKTAAPKSAGSAESTGSTSPRSARKKAAAAAAAEEKAPPAAPKPAPKETLSLIDGPPKRVRTEKKPEDRPRRALPPISRIQADRNAPPVQAAPVVEISEPEATVTAPVSAEETPSDDKIIHIKPPIIVKELAAQMGLKPFQLIHDLMEMNIFASINQSIEPDVATSVCKKHGFIFEKEKREKGAGVHKVEVVVEAPPPPVVEKEEELKFRAPIVTFMGHVDHGKTSLMDAIRKTRVAAGEAGGITQHIGAYSVDCKGNKITFLDTPGHAAFTAMRARGANITDIVVIVVAADDGIMPQTLEAINHAKAAKVKIIVAINKVDLASANIDKVKGQLQEKGLNPEDWGGDTICCPVSATKGTGIDHLLEMILLESELLELKANPKAAPRGTVIEAQVEPGRGPTATVIVRTGTLKVGAPFICGNYSGKVKSLIDDLGKQIKEAGPSTPAKILGFSGLPNAGDEFLVMETEKAAKQLSEERLAALRTEKLATPQRATLENLFASLSDNQRKSLNIILKADVQGSLEALVASLNQIDSKKIDLAIIHSAVGPISESDVLLASASNAVIVGFNTKVENSASSAAKREGIQVKLYSIIYELIDQIKEAMAGLLDPELRETVVGHAEIKQVFQLTKGTVAGCVVTDGRIVRTGRARLLRKRQPIYDGGIATLRRFQDDVKEVRSGVECGIKLGDFTEYQPDDIVECYVLEKVPQQL